jgi:hypothetical protein
MLKAGSAPSPRPTLSQVGVQGWRACIHIPGRVLPPLGRHQHTSNTAPLTTYFLVLVDRYRHVPEIKRIERHRHVPKVIHKAGKLRRTMADAAAVKQARRVAHAKEGSLKTAPARKRKVVNQEE